MFGYITVNTQELKVREAETYRSYYCGLCSVLHEKYGRLGQLLLNYDMTFLVLLLDGLYEPSEQQTKKRCITHPAKRHAEIVCEYTEYAADMTVLLAYQKAGDDWLDERNRKKRALMALLKRRYETVRAQYPAQAKAVETATGQLRALEQRILQQQIPADMALLDQLAGRSGAFLAQLFAPQKDLWTQDLKELGFYLGKAVYLMDAYEDLPQDETKGRFNLLISLKEQEGDRFEETLRLVLEDTMMHASRHFEHLPIERNLGILRNILYSGIWMKYAVRQKAGEAEKTNEKSL